MAGQKKAEQVVRDYFGAIGAHDVQRAAAMWAPEGLEDVRGQGRFVGPDGVREFIGSLIEAVPDLRVEIVSTTTEGERCAIHWRFSGTFAGPGRLSGVAPTGHRLALEGLDLLSVRDGLIQSNDAFPDTLAVPRQLGMLPAQNSPAEQRMASAFNLKTRLTDSLFGAGEARLIAEGVWLVQGQPGRCNVYLIENPGDASGAGDAGKADDAGTAGDAGKAGDAGTAGGAGDASGTGRTGGVTMFDAGARTMTRAVARAGARLGGITQIVLGHAHDDHRGTAPGLGVPVWCHPDEVQDAEGNGGWRYWPADLAGLSPAARQVHKLLHRYAFDDGPVRIAGTVSQGEQVAGFEVIDLPGHAPGLIGLWRESDRLALVSDCFYTIDMWSRDVPAHVPEHTYNYDTEQARASIRKLAELEPAAVWAGHGDPVVGDVRGQLLRAADAG